MYMRIAGFLLLAAGWVIVTSALFLLSAGARAAFVVAGIAVQMLGLIFSIRTHRVMESERD
jgi:hypothetical protein